MICGGGHLDSKITKEIQTRFPHLHILQTFGTNELSGTCMVNFVGNHKLESCGQLLPNYKAKILDANTGKPLGPNQKGNLVIQSPTIMKGKNKNHFFKNY